MLLVCGRAGGTELTGTIYEPGDEPPTYHGAPDDAAPYTWICDEFYAVESGGVVQKIDGREVRIAFESPVPRGFESRDAAVRAAETHFRTQFARLGVPASSVTIDASQARDAT